MARGSKSEIVIYAGLVPLIDSAVDYALTGLIPGGSYAIKHFCERSTEIDPGVETVLIDLIFDAQTSGGLVFSLEASKAEDCLHALKKAGVHDAAIIGEVRSVHPKGRLVIKQST